MENIIKDYGINMHNVRIEELANLAGYIDQGSNHTAYRDFNHEEFAKLIISDCMNLCNKESSRFLHMNKLEWGLAIENLRITIEDHFKE